MGGLISLSWTLTENWSEILTYNIQSIWATQKQWLKYIDKERESKFNFYSNKKYQQKYNYFQINTKYTCVPVVIKYSAYSKSFLQNVRKEASSQN